ncbi:MAG: Gfo/Idh/MocA family oxidoreductase [Saprospiraceae bacterium]|nr:Gfo/Idh/MocA family oxidoreductase [Saprospiraceae bacterium]
MYIKNKVRFAVLGFGFVGKRHATIIQQQAEAELVAVCDIDPEKRAMVEGLELPFYENFEALLAAQLSIDVLCVCTPNGLHAEHAIAALEARYHVVCEKPMGLTKASCEDVIFKSLNVSRHVFCVMQNRYSPPSQWIKDVVENGLLGDIYMVQVNCYWNRDDRYYFREGKAHPWKGRKDLDGGTLFTQFSHFIDMMYWLFGDIEEVQAKFADFNHQHATDFEDSGVVSFKFVNGGMGSMNYSTSVYGSNMESSLLVIGEKGSVKIGGQYMNEVVYCNIQDYTMPDLPPTNPANNYGIYKGSAANHIYVIENVIDVLKGRKSITTNALEGLKVVEIIEKIYALKGEL